MQLIISNFMILIRKLALQLDVFENAFWPF